MVLYWKQKIDRLESLVNQTGLAVFRRAVCYAKGKLQDEQEKMKCQMKKLLPTQKQNQN